MSPLKSAKLLSLGLGLLLATGVQAAEPPAIEAPPPPPQLQSGDSLEADVTIRQEGAETIYEYRLNGQLVMVKVQPKGAPAYYFVDRNGDGSMERTDDPREAPQVNQWVLFHWW